MGLIIRKIAIEIQNPENHFNQGFQLHFSILSFNIYLCPPTYSAEQLPRLNRILAFKDLGFSLEQISQLLDEQASIVQIRSMLRLKQAELQNHIQAERERLARVEARLQQIEQENQMRTQDVVIKKLEPAIVVSIREILPNYSAIGQWYHPLFDYLEQHKIKPGYCG